MKYSALIFTILLILAACAAPQQKSKAQDVADQIKQEAEQPEEIEAVPVETTEKNEEPVEAEPTPIPEPAQKLQESIKEQVTSESQPRTKMYNFLDTFEQKVTGYQFKYKRDLYFVRGTKYKIILYQPVSAKDVSFGEVKKSLFYYDTIYVDRATNTAVAYCEGHSSVMNNQCTDLEIFDLAYPVDFKEKNILLPEDWLFSYLNKEPDLMQSNKYFIESRSTIFVKFDENPQIELSFDPGTGLVIRADQKDGNQLIKRYDYELLAANSVRDIDVRHRSKSEIPSSETFYRTNT